MFPIADLEEYPPKHSTQPTQEMMTHFPSLKVSRRHSWVFGDTSVIVHEKKSTARKLQAKQKSVVSLSDSSISFSFS